MILPLSWLKQYVTVSESIEDVAERFIGLGFESEVLDDDRIDLDITPNRGDVLSIVGLAREYAASTEQELKLPETAEINISDNLDGLSIQAEPNAYHRITATIIKNVNVGPSPEWLRKAIESVGGNSINTIVDLTNYVMFELGMPMHAFDLDRLPASEILVRQSKSGEHFTSLKNEQKELIDGLVVVESGSKIIDLVGIRGGKEGMIEAETKNILLWAVSVPRPLIRKATKKLNIRTDASYRHERETDWSITDKAVGRFITLLTQLNPELELSDAIDLKATEQEVKQVELNIDKLNSLLGTTIDQQEAVKALESLGFKVDNNSVTVPSWRHFDINYPEDIIEEVARMHGYNLLPRKIITPTTKLSETRYAKIESLKDMLVEAGLTETYTESFSAPGDATDSKNLALLANPVNRDFAFCRPSLIPNLLKLLSLNSWSDNVRVFEVGNIFPDNQTEITALGLAAYGNQTKLFSQWVPESSITILKPDMPEALKYKLRRPVTIAEIKIESLLADLTADFKAPKNKPSYKPVSALPPSVRDISVIIDQDVDIDTLTQDMFDISPEHIISVELFDQFASDKFGPHMQSLAFHIVYQSVDKTLETNEVEELHQKVTSLLTEKYGATIR